MGCNFSVCWACAKIGCSLDEHPQKLVTRWLSMRKNWLLVGWAYTKIGYSLAEQAQILVSRWLSMRKTGYSLAEHTRKSFRSTTYIFRVILFSMSSFPPSPSPIPVYRPISHASRLCHVSVCPLSYVSVPNCLLSSVPCLTSLFLVSRPLYYVSRDLSLASHPSFSVP